MMYRYVITLGELKKLQQKGEAVLADVREPESFRAGHIPGAISVPYTEEQSFERNFRKQVVSVLCCDRGNLSMRATMRLRKAGYSAYSLAGGYEGYRRLKK